MSDTQRPQWRTNAFAPDRIFFFREYRNPAIKWRTGMNQFAIIVLVQTPLPKKIPLPKSEPLRENL
jgi:hypothetical protein